MRPRGCSARSASIEASGLAPDGIVFTGDLVDLGEGDAYARAACDRRAVRGPARHAGVLGDGQPRRPRGLPRRSCSTSTPPIPMRPVDRVDELDGLRLVTLDSTVPGLHHGELRDEQLAWLARGARRRPHRSARSSRCTTRRCRACCRSRPRVELRDQARLAARAARHATCARSSPGTCTTRRSRRSPASRSRSPHPPATRRTSRFPSAAPARRTARRRSTSSTSTTTRSCTRSSRSTRPARSSSSIPPRLSGASPRRGSPRAQRPRATDAPTEPIGVLR